jgi:hypothetical protein
MKNARIATSIEFSGSPTWIRTRDLRINRRMIHENQHNAEQSRAIESVGYLFTVVPALSCFVCLSVP